MKALSIKQPWASLIVEGIKDIENRTWKTNYRGRIYIHVSQAKKFNVQMTDEQTKKAFPVLTDAMNGNLHFGAIIGEVDIVDCVINHESIWAEKSPDTKLVGRTQVTVGKKPTYNWVLANPTAYIHPYRNVKGKLSFWEFDKIAHLKKRKPGI